MAKPRILLVDDDPNILQGYSRQLRKIFTVDTAQGGEEGLSKLTSDGPYPVVVADMQMPRLNGVQFLSKVRDIAPDTVRIMLTGNADQQTASDAVNQGRIFRFLNKPCQSELLAAAINEGLEHYRLVRAERDLISKTLTGSISMLTEILSLVHPVSFGRGTRLKELSRKISSQLELQSDWELQLAAMLSHVGTVAVPESVLEKAIEGESLSDVEQSMFDKHPEIGHKLVGKIPRLERVAEIVLAQDCRLDQAAGEGGATAADIPLESRILKVPADFDSLSSKMRTDEAIEQMQGREGWYDADVLAALEAVVTDDHGYFIREVKVHELTCQMILDEHVTTLSGEVLLAEGQPVVQSMLDRLKNFARTAKGVREPIRVRCPGTAAAESQEPVATGV